MKVLQVLLGDAFRIFFLAAGLSALLSMLVWEIWIGAGGLWPLPMGEAALSPPFWHAHEMIFGYGSAALAGFLLTAAPNWTNAPGAARAFLAVAAGLWFAGRLAVWLAGLLPSFLVMAVDLMFLPLLAANLLVLLIRRPKPQQMIFLAILALFWTANLAVHLDWMGWTDTGRQGLRAGLLTLSALIVLLGGRVIPGFTRNAMVQSGEDGNLPRNPAPLALISVSLALAVPLGLLAGAPDPVVALPALGAGGVALARLSLWRGIWTRHRPILWTLHLSYAANAAGLVALSASLLGLGSEIASLHLIAIGGVGGMTLSVMTRASLGHSGRPLVAPRPVALAYALLPLSALSRVAVAVFPDWAQAALLLAGALWISAFALYLAVFLPIFLTPRPPRATVGAPPK